MKNKIKLYKQRLECLVNVVDQCLSVKVPLFILKKTLKLYLEKKAIDIVNMEEQHFKLLLEQTKDYMLKIEREN